MSLLVSLNLTKYQMAACSRFCWAERNTFCSKSAHFRMFFAYKSAILNFFKKIKNTSGVSQMHYRDQNYSSLALTVFAVASHTDGQTDGRTAGKPISPFGLCEPVGDKNMAKMFVGKIKSSIC